MKRFVSDAIEGHRTRPDISTLKGNRIRVNEIADSRELIFFIQCLKADHPSPDRKAVAAIERVSFVGADHLATNLLQCGNTSGAREAKQI